MKGRLLAVMNPSAHDWEAEKRWPQMEPILRQHAEVKLLKTVVDNEETVAKVQAAVMAGCERVLAIGGDGTVQLTLSGIMRATPSQLPQFAVIPFGTANNVSKCLGLPLQDLEKMAAVAVGDRLRGLDVCELLVTGPEGARKITWTNCVSIGMDADIVAARARFRKLGSYLSYAAALAERTLEQRSMDVRLEVDGQVRSVRVFNVIVTNVPLYAGALRMPGAVMDDGLLDAYLFDRNEYTSKVLSYAVKQADVLEVGLGELLEELTENQRTVHGKSVKMKLAFPRALQVDGEGMGEVETLEMKVVGQLQAACA